MFEPEDPAFFPQSDPPVSNPAENPQSPSTIPSADCAASVDDFDGSMTIANTRLLCGCRQGRFQSTSPWTHWMTL